MLTKTCSKCGIQRNEGDFYLRENGNRRNDCKSCVKSRVAVSPSKVARDLAAAERKASRTPYDATTSKARWYQENKQRVREKNAQWAAAHEDQMRAYRRGWQQRNPENGRETSNRHRARKMGEAFVIPGRDWERLVRRYDAKCAYCLVAPFEHQDHILPLSRGGRHGIGNVIPSCRACNQSKGAKTLTEWRKAC